ncbi:hypothetical protein MMC25_006072 [Agyrium rufum]|nr:hypothetical protein [Agyrium rufum]
MLGLLPYMISYLLGGLTFIPLVLGLAFYLLPPPPTDKALDEAPLELTEKEKQTSAELAKKFQRNDEPEVAAGYFAVCREYVPGGQNGKPPERTTPAGEVIAEESPSVYQSMYRSIFDRKQPPTLEPAKVNGKPVKKANNIFYLVLRHQHLILFETIEQLEVRHVISLNHHDVSIYGEGAEIPEGELWIKRNAICLTRKPNIGDVTSTSKPFYLFSENCSEKEDFYFAMLQNQERQSGDTSAPPCPQQYELKDIIALVQRLHSSEEHLQTRWVNAFVGRLFLAMYKTQDIEDYMRTKITKKIARVKKPAFLSNIVLQKIDLGEAAPYITNPRLKDLTVDGDCCAEADIKYHGNFRLEIATTARIDLGARFKAREVTLVLAVVIKKIEGHGLLRLKPPPSNRLWVTFEKMPHIEMHIEPIVSSRQITYSVILRAIESRIREVIAETMVLPHWDDSPFTNTSHQRFRGGIWVRNEDTRPTSEDNTSEIKPADDLLTDTTPPVHPDSPLMASPDERSMSMPALQDPPASPGLGWSFKKASKANSIVNERPSQSTSTSSQVRPDMPKVIRSRSFASSPRADPVLTTEPLETEIPKPDMLSRSPPQQSATEAMKAISQRSQPTSPSITPNGLTSRPLSQRKDSKTESVSSESSKDGTAAPLSLGQAAESIGITADLTKSDVSDVSPSLGSHETVVSIEGTDKSGSSHPPSLIEHHPTASSTLKKQSLATIGATAMAAKKWGWNVLSRPGERNVSNPSNPERSGTSKEPMGRGRPLPPRGQPLPPPERRRVTPITMPKRKPLPPPLLPDRRVNENKSRDVPPTLPTRRKHSMTPSHDTNEGMLIVAAPYESAPGTPAAEADDEFVYQMRVQSDEEDDTRMDSGRQGQDRNSDTGRATSSLSSRIFSTDEEQEDEDGRRWSDAHRDDGTTNLWAEEHEPSG